METTGEKPTLYKIKIQGPSGCYTDLWNNDICILSSEKDGTLLVCQVLDQAALCSFLHRLWNLNLTILTVERIEDLDYNFSLLPEMGRK